MRAYPALLVVLAACGHSYTASLGATRRGDGALGGQATVGARLHLFSSGHSPSYAPIGIRAGIGVERDGARAIIEVVEGFSILSHHRGPAAGAEVRFGSGVGGSVIVGASSVRSTDDAEWHLLPDAPIPYQKDHFRAIGLELGAEKSELTDASVWRFDADATATFGVTAADRD